MYYFRVILEQKPICNSGESGNINIQQLDVVCSNKECFFLHLRNIYLKTQQELPALSETTLNIFCVHWTNSRLCYFCFNTDTKHLMFHVLSVNLCASSKDVSLKVVNNFLTKWREQQEKWQWFGCTC